MIAAHNVIGKIDKRSETEEEERERGRENTKC